MYKSTRGWLKNHKEKGNGIRHHYNFRADHNLGMGYIAARRIPCACNACQEQLKETWVSGVPFNKQLRYLSDNRNCALWHILGSLNNWRIVSLHDSNNSRSDRSSSVTKSIFRNTLRSKAMSIATQIEVGRYAAISTTDENTLSGYYVCCITSKPYILNDNSVCEDAHNIAKGELVCNIT